MNKDEAKQFLPLVQALVDGKTIQFKTSDGRWEDRTNGASFSYPPERYRVKPEPVYTGRYKRYMYDAYKAGVTGDKNRPYEVLTLNEFDGYNVVSPVQNSRGFVGWIDHEWQKHEIPSVEKK